VLITPVALCVGLAIWTLCGTGSTSGIAPSSLQGDAALRLLKEQGFYDSLREAVTAARYDLHEDSDRPSVWRGSNEANDLRAEFNLEGVRVEAAGAAGRLHRMGLKLRAIGYGDREVAIGTGSVSAKQNRIEITRSMTGGQLTEWYVNTASGLEQGFTLGASPGERRPGERLRVAMTVEGDLRVRPGGTGQAIELENGRGESVLRYEKLAVEDSRGRKLAAAMVARAGELWLEVDDRDAVYPVTIDPILTQHAYLKASNTGANDSFGYSIGVSGDTVVVGAVNESSNATGVGGDQSDNSAISSGAAYVFVRSAGVWSQQAYLKASNTEAGDFFGGSVAVSGDTIVVGAINESSNATGVDGNQNNNSAISSGAAYVFVRSSGVWSQLAYLKASNTGAGDWFGRSVAVSGDTVVIGAIAEDSSATGVDGNQSDNSASISGAAYVFVQSVGGWSQQAYLKASNTGALDVFGWSVAVSGDTIIVGASGEDSNATGVDGDQTNNSAINSGAAYVFLRSAGVWSQQAYLKASNTGAGDQFSGSVAVSGDTAVVGADQEASNATGVNGNESDNSAGFSGAAYVFVRSAGVWIQQAYLKASNTRADAYFGGSVAVSGDTVVLGAVGESSNATGVNGNESDNSAFFSGAAYVFVRSAGVWSQQAYLKASNTEAGDQFGWSVAQSGDTILVGAVTEASNATGVNGGESDNSALASGSAYLFSTPTQAIEDLIATIEGMGLPSGVASSLSAPLRHFNPDEVAAACGKLGAFIHQVNAKVRSGHLTPAQAAPLLEAANAIRASLGCTP
jgi:hypothetical protein